MVQSFGHSLRPDYSASDQVEETRLRDTCRRSKGHVTLQAQAKSNQGPKGLR